MIIATTPAGDWSSMEVVLDESAAVLEESAFFVFLSLVSDAVTDADFCVLDVFVGSTEDDETDEPVSLSNESTDQVSLDGYLFRL